jgi:hypothetical protein
MPRPIMHLLARETTWECPRCGKKWQARHAARECCKGVGPDPDPVDDGGIIVGLTTEGEA